MGGYVGRLAPSPTGALHLGNLRTFMVAWLRARAAGGRLVMRMEDLDHPRDKPGAVAQTLEELRWLGFDWDEEHVQSARVDVYRSALERLRAQTLAYPCVCSRRDVEAAQSAPHAGEQLHYPGTCRGRFATWAEAAAVRPPCWRFRVPDGACVAFEDVFAGPFEQDVSRALGDFPLARDENGAGYTLAVVVDDAAMGVTEVVRGDDLLPATPAQILLQRALGLPAPAYCHLPLAVGPDGRRLAKRHGDTRIAAFRAAGWSSRRLIGFVAASCGLGDGSPCGLRDLLPGFSLAYMPHSPWVVPSWGMYACG
jgi:glutamyl-tRNA synthetase